ncbi:hypothetical protein SNE35_11430 [Paucibacter sp. R3-3]|uniref:Uncharacterized protein n=1 Tax=Roseateles agri TaxID=3098619 RepID=A0ABU5DH56_9BURK|nr:hypothetical protein [Paucibacter sp. R3-3]MDY0745126.1 hypothetical protein [Paucibacter sp. R3-3]
MSLPAHLVPRKTQAARELLQQRPGGTSSLARGLRMLLITIDGRKSFGELGVFAQGLGLRADMAFEQLQAQGLVTWGAEAEAPSSPQSQASRTSPTDHTARLVRAKFFALDLSARMLAGRDQALRDSARGVDSESSFHAWIDQCAQAISDAGGAERAALFRERVAAAA